MTENQILHQVTDERVYQPMMVEIDAANVELGLNKLINMRHHYGCMARLEGRNQETIERLDREYEQALDTYRRVVGKEPTAA